MASVQILDGQTDLLLTELNNELPEGNIFWNDEHNDSGSTTETFDFHTRSDREAAGYLTGLNRVLIPGDRPGSWSEFIIFDVFKSNGGVMEVKTNGSYVEIATAPVLSPFDLGGITTETAMTYGLSGTDWQPGIIEYAGVQAVSSKDTIDRYSYLRHIAKVFDMKLRFRVVTNGNQFVGRYVDLVANLGSFEGKEIVLGKDLVGVTRRESSGDVATALVVEGPPQENGARIRVELKNEEARQRWGRNGQHRWGYFEVEGEGGMTQQQVIDAGTAELEKRLNSVVQYEVTAAALEHVFGLSHERASKGDKVRVKDTTFSPPLYLDARIIDVKRSISDPSLKVFILGEFIEYSEEQVLAQYRKLRAELATKLGRADVIEIVNEEAMIKSPIEPEDPPLNQLWMDTSKFPNIIYRWNGTEWVKSSATVPSDIGAVPPEYVDNKAEITQLRMEIANITSNQRQLGVEVANLNNNTYLSGNAVLTELNNRRTAFDAAAQEVITNINNTIADEQIAQVEMAAVEAARDDYGVAMDALINQIRAAEDEIVRQSANEVIAFGERKIFKGATVPAAGDVMENDLWLDARSTPPVWRQFINGSWTKISRTNMADMQGQITGVQITDDSINAEKIATNAITAKHISANVITSNMITTAGLDAGVITYGTMTGITADVGQAGMTAVGTSAASVRFWAGASFLNRETAPFRVTQSGGVVATNLNMTGGAITGGTIDIATNAKIGNDLYLGTLADRTDKTIYFNDGANISGGDGFVGGDMTINVSELWHSYARNNLFYGWTLWNGGYYATVDFTVNSDVNTIIDGPLQINGTDPTRNRNERGFMGIGAAQDNLAGTSGASFVGVGVNFRVKKTFVPSSIGTLQTSSNIGNSGQLNTTDINVHGFWLYLTVFGSATGYIYWRGEYLA